MEMLHCVSCQKETDGQHRCGKCHQLIHPNWPCSKLTDQSESKFFCSLCSNNAAVQEQRAGAKRKLEAQAEKTLHASRQWFEPAKIDQNVVIRIPKVDRGRADLQNLMAVVVEETDGFYKLGTKQGLLKRSYVRNEFEICKQSFFSVADVPFDKEISLREAVGAASLTGRPQGVFKCNCTTKCKTNSCSCKKNGFLCNSRCHNSLSCCNKWDWTEMIWL